ncbi:hypothetical protein [Salinibacter ruber]|uniref:hypothetical protein n=1 Tax=Salinibacter ruber TaxID=146919 RepID=UPI0021695738|nr:hypothetical protein [Salinibacter ruber]MCS4101382.1 hypothetical protein [Salinibacter ruber]
MPTLSPDVGAHLLKATRSQDLDEAFEKVLSEYLEPKLCLTRSAMENAGIHQVEKRRQL